MASLLPTFEQVLLLPDSIEGTVTSDFIDLNGHMNVVHYLDRNSDGADVLVRQIGIDEAYRSERRLGLFTAEHHLMYYSELREGDKFTVHTRVLGRTDKAVHMMTFLLDRSGERLSNTLEIMLVHVDLEARRAAAMPEDITAGFDHHIARSAALNWAAPTCGAIGLRR
ncbi:thioesterase family protein [Nocardia sp. NPDC052112]|uniref:thioesterase family protein n=1 Tax=Nocardia sp. NPDC052112 TaxID=3155646 RepID=UPI00343AD108